MSDSTEDANPKPAFGFQLIGTDHGRKHDYFLKLWRAQQHLDALKAEILAYIANPGEPFGLRHTFDSTLPGFRTTVREAVQLPFLRWSLIIGDFCNNARSTLDHLAWRIVQLGRTPNPDKPEKVGFPIWNTEPQFHSTCGVMLPGIRKEHLAVIRAYQPYIDGPAEASNHPLAQLKALNNLDKHRNLHVVATYAAGTWNVAAVEATDFEVTATAVGADLFACLQGGRGFFDGAELAVFTGVVKGPEPMVKVKVEGSSIFILESGLILPDALEWIGGRILTMVNELQPLL